MKKIFTHAAMLLMALVAMTSLTSCDSDTMLAYDLEGVWQGVVRQRDYFNYRYGRAVEYTDVEMYFSQRGSWEAGGTGYEIDWYGRSYSKTFFTWSVRNGCIYIRYDDSPYVVVVRDFDVYWQGNRQFFSGYFDNGSTGETLAAFDMIKVTSPNDYYETRYSYYYSREKRDSVATDSIAQ